MQYSNQYFLVRKFRIYSGNMCSNLTDKIMNKIKDSDLNPTMLASATFDNIIKQILSSNLNFQIQISPFSANISLKKTPIKDKLGAPMNPLRPALPSSFSNASSPD